MPTYERLFSDGVFLRAGLKRLPPESSRLSGRHEITRWIYASIAATALMAVRTVRCLTSMAA
jgi:hypothetical protein